MNPAEEKYFRPQLCRRVVKQPCTLTQIYSTELCGPCQVVETGQMQPYSLTYMHCWANVVLGLVCMWGATPFEILYTALRIWGKHKLHLRASTPADPLSPLPGWRREASRHLPFTLSWLSSSSEPLNLTGLPLCSSSDHTQSLHPPMQRGALQPPHLSILHIFW